MPIGAVLLERFAPVCNLIVKWQLSKVTGIVVIGGIFAKTITQSFLVNKTEIKWQLWHTKSALNDFQNKLLFGHHTVLYAKKLNFLIIWVEFSWKIELLKKYLDFSKI